MKSKSTLLLLGAITLMLAGLVLYIQSRKSGSASSEPVSASSVFSIPEGDMERLIVDARAGDCRSAYKIAQYHSFLTHQFDEAVIWLRIAAKCEDVPPKQALILMLLEREDESGVPDEIDRLLVELHKLDEEASKNARDWVSFRRKQGR